MTSLFEFSSAWMIAQFDDTTLNIIFMFLIIALLVVLFIFFITFGRLYVQALSSGIRISVFAFI